MNNTVNQSIKQRMQKSFLILTIGSIVLFSVFSLVFFYRSIRLEAIKNMETKNEVFTVIYQSKLREIDTFASSLANDRAISVPLSLDIRHTLSDYVREIVDRERNYHISLIDLDKELYVDVGLDDSIIIHSGRISSTDELQIYNNIINGYSTNSIILLNDGNNGNHPALAAARPIYREGQIIGGICVYYLLEDNPQIMEEFSNVLNTETILYFNSKPIVSTVNLEISSQDYINYTHNREERVVNFSILSGVETYIPLINFRDESVGIMRLYQEPRRYMNIFLFTLLVYALFTFATIFVAIYIVFRVSNSIVNPLRTLLGGVNKITEGDLTHNIILNVKDEIGTLGNAFNEMRQTLMEKIDTIETMNQDLEEKVEERTETINTLNNNLKNYLSPQLYESIVYGKRDASLSKYYRKKLTIFFSDLVNFTGTTEKMEPEEISKLLNSYLDEMTKVALEFEGTIDKFVGDAIMVFFGDPEFISDKVHALRAVKMALKMQDKLVELRIRWKKEGLINSFHARMGINTGYCTIGNFGAEMKMDYTIIGGNVNMASRFETLAKPDTVLISPETYLLVKDEIECKPIGEVKLKGIVHPVKVYQPVAIKEKRDTIPYVHVDGDKILFKNQLLETSNISKDEKMRLMRELKRAMAVISSNSGDE